MLERWNAGNRLKFQNPDPQLALKKKVTLLAANMKIERFFTEILYKTFYIVLHFAWNNIFNFTILKVLPHRVGRGSLRWLEPGSGCGPSLAGGDKEAMQVLVYAGWDSGPGNLLEGPGVQDKQERWDVGVGRDDRGQDDTCRSKWWRRDIEGELSEMCCHWLFR